MGEKLQQAQQANNIFFIVIWNTVMVTQYTFIEYMYHGYIYALSKIFKYLKYMRVYSIPGKFNTDDTDNLNVDHLTMKKS